MIDHAHTAALLGLPSLGPRRLRALLDAFDDSESAWRAVRDGRIGAVPLHAKDPGTLARQWQESSRDVDVDSIVSRHEMRGLSILDPTHPRWPAAFLDDPEPPPLLFVAGDAGLLDRMSVAVVGTRRCTAAGAAIARDLGFELAGAGVGIVSGLALGIDGAAHEGSLRAGRPASGSPHEREGGLPTRAIGPSIGPTIGIVATGLDVVYPRRHRNLWEQVAAEGVLITEAPLGTKAERWRFPARNRLIASLARAVVVVESATSGGSMLTVDSAIERQTDVLAVPGSPKTPTSAGTNQLIVDGAPVVRDAADVLAALGADVPAIGQTSMFHDDGPGDADDEGIDPAEDDPVARAVSWPPSSLDDIVAATGLGFTAVAARLAMLELDGVVERVADGYQRAIR